MKTLLLIFALLLGMGLADRHTTKPAIEIEAAMKSSDAAYVCAVSKQVTNGALEQRCANLLGKEY